MSGGENPVGGGVRTTEDRKGTLLPRASEGTVAVQGVQGGDGGEIIGGEWDDKEWAIGRGEMELENLGHGGRSAEVLPDQGRPAELPGGGMLRTSSNEDVNAGKFYAPACPGHHVHFVGGKKTTHGAPNATCRYPGVN